MTKSRPTFITLMLIALSVAMSIGEALLNSQGEVVSDGTQVLWHLIFTFSSIAWLLSDARLRKYHMPFDSGFLMYIFWPVAFPYYLVVTRGAEGLVVFLGFLTIWLAPWLSGVVAYVYFYVE